MTVSSPGYHWVSSSRDPARTSRPANTRIRIHQLTLPQSLSYASKLIPSPAIPTSTTENSLSGPSSPNLQRTLSHNELSRRERRISTSTLPDVAQTRERSASTSYAGNRSVRTGRARTPTLAGAAIEQAMEPPVMENYKEEGPAPTKRLARCFVVFKLPPTKEGMEEGHVRRRTTSCSSTPALSPTGPRRSRPGLPTSGSRTSITNGDSPRQRTILHPARPDLSRHSSSNNRIPLYRTASERAKARSGTETKKVRPSVSTHPSFSSLRAPLSPRILELVPSVPFYISPIHKPSTHPRFVNLSTDDFAPWLTVEEAAATMFTLELWYQDESEWKMLEGVGGDIEISSLRRIEGKNQGVDENTVQMVFTSDPKAIWYLPKVSSGTDDVDGVTKAELPTTRRESVKGILERSRRETRMRKGTGVGSLHQ